jgi:hypothetical protein
MTAHLIRLPPQERRNSDLTPNCVHLTTVDPGADGADLPVCLRKAQS